MARALIGDTASISIELENETWKTDSSMWRGGRQLLFIFNLGSRLGSTSGVTIIANSINTHMVEQ